MMQPTFILSYPRSRTAWLSMFLTGAGAFCFHEAWKMVSNVMDLRSLMEPKGTLVVNSDCSNIFFLDDLKREFPDARYIRILQSEDAVRSSLLQSYGPHDYEEMFVAYRAVFQGVEADLTVDCATWSEQDTRAIWSLVSGNLPLDSHWLSQCESMLVQLMPWQIEHDILRASRGNFNHVIQRMRGTTWA